MRPGKIRALKTLCQPLLIRRAEFCFGRMWRIFSEIDAIDLEKKSSSYGGMQYAILYFRIFQILVNIKRLYLFYIYK